MFSLESCLYLSAILFSIGIYGVLARRNIIVVLMALELMLNGVNLTLVAFGRAFVATSPAEHTGQVFALMVLAVAAAEAAVGLSILLLIWRRWQTIDVRDVSRMFG